MMKTFFRISLKQAVFAASTTALVLSVFFLQNNSVQGKNTILHATTNVPLAGAKILLTKVSGNSVAQASLSTTSAQDGSFTFPVVTTDQRGTGMITYTLTVLPAVTYTITDPKSGRGSAIPNRTPVSVSITFNQLKGLVVGSALANTGPIGPFTFMSSDSLKIGVGFGGVISGTVTKQQ
ncbi:MAG: hypothetical protein ACHQM6_02405 [Candidatus Kapaibacterium sp.]